MRHLAPPFAAAALRRGVDIEQYLGSGEADGTRFVEWLTASPSDGGYAVNLHRVEDVGTDDFLDISEFPPLDPDEYVGEGRLLGTSATPEGLLALAEQHGAEPDRWVNQGVAAADYEDARPSPD